MISLITWQHLNVYSYKLKNNVCVISIFHLYEAKKKNWLLKSYSGWWSKKLTSGPVYSKWKYFPECQQFTTNIFYWSYELF